MSWSKYIVQKKQEYSGGTWVDVVPLETRQGEKIGEYPSYEECIAGGDTRWVNVDINEDYWCDECPTPVLNWKFKATYSGGNTYELACNVNSTLTSGETRPNGYNWSAMTEAVIGDCVSTISQRTFSKNKNLKTVRMSDNVTSIKGNDVNYAAFADCSALTNVNLSTGLTEIEGYLFYGCTSLKSIKIPSGVTEIGEHAFWNCNSLSSITIPNSVRVIESGACHDCSSLTSVVIPNSVTTLNWSAFGYCSGLTNVTIGSGLTTIGEQAFEFCTRLNNCTIGNSVTVIDRWAFSDCSGLTSINIPNSVTTIGMAAFIRCSGLTACTIGTGIESIGVQAFVSCSNLRNLTVYATTPPTLSSGALAGTAIANNTGYIYVPSGSVNAYKNASQWSYFSSRITAIPNS